MTSIASQSPAVVATRPLVRPTDVLLASFPRSGNTWKMNILLRSGILALPTEAFRASVVKPAELKKHAGLFAPSVKALKKRWDGSELRLIKTHDLPRIWGSKAVYIYRDGRDVVTSFFFYLKSRGQIPESTTFSEFLWKDRSLLPAWASQVSAPDYQGKGPAGLWAMHVCFWRAACSFKQLHLMQYEKLLNEPVPTLTAMFDFLGAERTEEQIQKVVEETSFEKLRKAEPTNGDKAVDASKRFFRSGKSGNWREHFSKDDIEPFKEQAGQTLIELGYEDNLRWDL